MGILSGLKSLQHKWELLGELEKNPYRQPIYSGTTSYLRPDRPRFRQGNERTIINAIFTRIAVDCASIPIHHVKTDSEGNFDSPMDSGLEQCLTIQANKDQTGRQLIQDIVMSVCDEGCVAVVPISADINPEDGAFNMGAMRTAHIQQWYPDAVQVNIYNEEKGIKQDIIVPKKMCAIIENPFFSVMNEPNSILQRLIRKLTILDAVDEHTGSGKLDLLIQLPYTIRSEQRREQAERRTKDIEAQLRGSKYGIAYIDATEHVTQLNGAVENHLLDTIEYLTNLLFSQLGFSEAILNGTAEEQELLNYNNRITEPMLAAITDEFKRKWLSKTARSQGQSIVYIRDPFRLVPVNQMAEIADKFTRNEILSPNEIRSIIGRKPSKDPESDVLRNRNLNKADNEKEQPLPTEEEQTSEPAQMPTFQNGSNSDTNTKAERNQRRRRVNGRST